MWDESNPREGQKTIKKAQQEITDDDKLSKITKTITNGVNAAFGGTREA